jgi:uncharacterized membrane protein YfcA
MSEAAATSNRSWRLPALAGGALVPLALLFALHPQPVDALARLWPVIPLAYVAAAFANATAIGGGFVFVPVFILGYGIGPISALQLSLGTQAVGMSSGALGWSRRYIDVRALALATAFAALGMLFGTLVWAPSPLEVKAVFGWVSLAIAVAVALELRFGGRANNEDMPALRAGELLGYALACVLGGLVTAWVSLGIGEVVALWLLFRHRVRVEKAIGTGVAALAVCSIVGLALHGTRSFASYPWEYLAFTTPGVLLGGFSGARAGRWIEARAAARRERGAASSTSPSPLKLVFVVVVLIDGLVMLAHVHLH